MSDKVNIYLVYYEHGDRYMDLVGFDMSLEAAQDLASRRWKNSTLEWTPFKDGYTHAKIAHEMYATIQLLVQGEALT